MTGQTLKAVLSEDLPHEQIVVELDAFIKFDLLLDHELDSLEARWESFAAPQAARPTLRQLRPKKAK